MSDIHAGAPRFSDIFPLRAAIRQYRTTRRQDAFLGNVFWMVLSLDLVLVLAHVVHELVIVAGVPLELESLRLNQHSSFASVWNYSQLMLICAVLANLWLKTRRRAFALMLMLFLMLLVDDYFEAHDRVGFLVGNALPQGWMQALTPQARGEVIVYPVMIALAAPLLWLAQTRAPVEERTFFSALIAGTVVLGIFGIGVDVLHALLNAALGNAADVLRRTMDRAMTVLEDGGETVAFSLCLWLCLARLKAMAP
ncbi:hypothetical protein [Roseovarius salis]|uniref:hypothetical protein n=1 Tax=Roseovarius salis TaxID=3376063 RepID=UPI0037C80360